MGVVYIASRIGAACAPFVVQMTRLNAILPFAVMGGMSFVAAIMCWVLPETLGRSTAEVMEDTEMEARKNGITLTYKAEQNTRKVLLRIAFM